MNKKISKKICFLQALLSVLIVILHSMNTTYSGLKTTATLGIVEFFVTTLAQVAVPIFFFLSAFLFYWNCHSITVLRRKQKSRVYTLVLPYLFWNLIWTCYYYVISRIGVGEYDFTGYNICRFFEDILLSKHTFLCC